MGESDKDRIPPGQTVTRKFPVTGEKSANTELRLENYQLSVFLGEKLESSMNWDQLLRIPSQEHQFDIHCVTSWSRLNTNFRGILLNDLINSLNIKGEDLEPFSFVRFEAYSERKHDTSLPTSFALRNSWLAFEIDGKPLEPEHGFPIRLITPSRYFYKSLKWLKTIQFIPSDRKGFWERTSSYHNVGLPWEEQRFENLVSSNIKELEAFKSSSDFSEYTQSSHPIIFLKSNFKNWKPNALDLTGVQLKNCNFNGAQLQGVIFDNANLTLSKFHGAQLKNARFIGTDLEGVDFSGANLEGAYFENNPMSATKFEHKSNGGLTGFKNMTVKNAAGLLESQIEYLSKLGIELTLSKY